MLWSSINILFDVTIFLLVPVISHSGYLSWMFPCTLFTEWWWRTLNNPVVSGKLFYCNETFSFLRKRLTNLDQREPISYCLTVPRTLIGLIPLVTFCGATTWPCALTGERAEVAPNQRRLGGRCLVNDHMLWESSSWLIWWSIWTRRQFTELVHRRLMFQQYFLTTFYVDHTTFVLCRLN